MDLLEDLYRNCGCMYLSDLKAAWMRPIIFFRINKMDPQNYPLKDWNEAVWYLTGIKRQHQDPVKAKESIIQWSKKN